MARVRYEDDDEEFEEDDEYDGLDGPDLGPDERDADLLDGSWERRYYTEPSARGRDWRSIQVGIGLLLVMALVLPLILAAMP